MQTLPFMPSVNRLYEIGTIPVDPVIIAPKGPDDVIDYTFRFAELIGPAGQIVSATCIPRIDQTGIETVLCETDGSSVFLYLRGGVVGTNIPLELTLVLQSPKLMVIPLSLTISDPFADPSTTSGSTLNDGSGIPPISGVTISPQGVVTQDGTTFVHGVYVKGGVIVPLT